MVNSMWSRLPKKLKNLLLRNKYLIGGGTVTPGRVNLDYWNKSINVGDVLGPVITEWILERKGISKETCVKHTKVLLTVGSVIGMRPYDAVIWGSGILSEGRACQVLKRRKIVKLDVRAVRGPITRKFLAGAGYDVKDTVCGDPAILMPLLYFPEKTEKKYKASIITHWSRDCVDEEAIQSGLHTINVATDDYRFFIDEICSSERVISSSLHGIILAEAYGVPAVFINRNNCMDAELLKFYDWYLSTDRPSVVVARSMTEALNAVPMELPQLSDMQANLLQAFPYDIFEEKR